jgi:hypothetical protein
MSMDNRYWINGSGNWSDTSHWSYTSGGSGGAPAPTQNDNVYFDGNSFNTGFTVTLTAHSSCKNFNCTGLNQELTITASDRRLSIYGSVVLSPYLTTVFQSYTNFFSLAATTNETIRYNNAHIDQLRLIGSGSWTLLDTLNPAPNKSFEGSVIIEDGTLNTANQTIMTRYFTIYGGTFNAGSSTIYVSEILHIYDSCVFNCGTSHIIMDGVDQYFNGEGKTFYDVTIEGNGWTGAGAEIYGNNTFHNLILLRYNDDIPRVRFQAGSTQTITNAFSCNGTSSQTFYLEGVSNSTWYLVFSGSGIVSCNYLTINYSSASPANKWYAGPNSVQGTGVSGWIFSGGPTPSITPSISPSPTPGP